MGFRFSTKLRILFGKTTLQRALQTTLHCIKKGLQSLETLAIIGGEYRNRTDDLLTASQTL